MSYHPKGSDYDAYVTDVDANRSIGFSEELQRIEFLQFRYTDLLGKFLAKYVMSDYDELYGFLKKGIGLDGSSVKGFAEINESDLLLVPDRHTLRLNPFFSNFTLGSVIANVHKGFGFGRLSRDPRFVSENMEEYLAESNLTCQIGPEVECFVFDDISFRDKVQNVIGTNNRSSDEANETLPSFTNSQSSASSMIVSEEQYGVGKYPINRKGGYDAPPFQDSLVEFRFEVANLLKKYYGIKVTNLNHEVASTGQIEINFMHSKLTDAADNVQIYKDVVRNVAKRHNKIANFMPKPLFDETDPTGAKADNGSGMHVSVSLWDKSSSSSSTSSRHSSSSKTLSSQNIFFDGDDQYANISQSGRYFIGGILDHSRSLVAITSPTVNSYYRMVPGFEAPVYIAWSRGNRSAIVRIPINDKLSRDSKRIEFRAPDPSCNPYLALSAIVAAGLDGMRKKIEPGDPIDENIYKMSDSRRMDFGIKSVPGSLEESIVALKSDHLYLTNSCFNDECLETYIDLKENEISMVREFEEKRESRLQQFYMYYDV
ncbi:MAG TPA: type I glutamate--ammonia ligase [Nitrososphaeraceae archaeon]|nr:type I glutamate--ammonia ligase [Nitrososphaeraceae archaeon]